tara:strand:- start:431 stop:562 length:132 start_codon:yes stop_codon:yes gene_type:complete
LLVVVEAVVGLVLVLVLVGCLLVHQPPRYKTIQSLLVLVVMVG